MWRCEDPRYFEAWKTTKKYQGADMEKIQDRSWGHKNRMVQFPILEGLIFQIRWSLSKV
jgi:hypothetical protein